jgi:hypothetical protein
MRFKIDGEIREISDEVFNFVDKNPHIGYYRTPQEWGVDGLTWEDKDLFYFTIFDNKVFMWRTICDFDEPENAKQICKEIIKALRKKGIKATMDEIEEGHYTVDVWYETGKKFEELTIEDLRKPLEIYKIFRTIDEEL